MTDIPIAEQIAAVREPGWYWVRWQTERPRPMQWDGSRWVIYGTPYRLAGAEIGPHIPDPVTLQQHERDREKVAELMLRNSIATGHGDTIDDLLSELDTAIQRDRERYERAMTALRFYADERRYDYDETCSPTGRNPAGGDVLSDNGERAREAITVPERNNK